MKNSIKIFGIALSLIAIILSVTSCKKYKDDGIPPTNFEEITEFDIEQQASSLSNAKIVLDSSGYQFNFSDVIIYRTNSNRYGKLEILELLSATNNKLTIRAVTFRKSGAIKRQTSSLSIRGTWLCDLDAMKERELGADFWWERDANEVTYLTPEDDATFAIYNF